VSKQSDRKCYRLSLGLLLLAISGTALAAGTGSVETSTLPSGSRADAVALALYISLALSFSFLCSVAEAVLLSITPSYIEDLRARRPTRAALYTRLKYEQVDRSLAAILTLNTIAHTVGAIGAGAKATLVFGSAWFGVFSAVITLMILFLSEIVPKTIGAVYWARLAGPAMLFVQGLIVSMYPLVWVSEKVTKVIASGKSPHIFSRDEFLAMARIGERTGQLAARESRVIRNLLEFGFLKARDIMTPRPVVSALPEDITIAQAVERVGQSRFSRIPIYKTGLDDVTGFVLRYDVLLGAAEGRRDELLSSLRRDMLAVPETVSLPMLLERFFKERQHISLVFDEHGGAVGLVTLEDLIETLIGIEILDEKDKVGDMRALARKLWTERAKALGIDSELVEEGAGGPVHADSDQHR
jgi:CBS domain containing-hemolysin-like protein